MFFREFNQRNLQILRKISNYTAKLWRWEYTINARNPVIKSSTKSQKYLDKLSNWSDIAYEGQFADGLVDYKASRGNFIIDEDGNQILDLSMQGGQLALGYNPDPLIFSRIRRNFDKYLTQTPNLAEYPPHDFSDFVRGSVIPFAPEGMGEVLFTDGSGSLANENAIKAALLKFKETRGGLAEIDWDNFASNDFSNSGELLQNKVSVLSFVNSTHGRTIAGLSTSNLPRVNSISPKYNWPVASTPKTTYPYQDNKEINVLEENSCLEEVRNIISQRKDTSPVGAIIIEPITFIGHSMATPTYYRQLRAIAKENGIPFIVDETRTGFGKTGKFWAHEHWYLDDAPDFVTFGTSAVASGYFTTAEFRPLEAHKLATIGNGSMYKLVAFSAIANHIKSKKLTEKVEDVGGYIKAELNRVNKGRNFFKNLRGYGTYLGLDLDGFKEAKHLQTHLIRNGILVAMVGPQTLGIRPSLLLEPSHASHLRDALIDYNPNFHFDVVFE